MSDMIAGICVNISSGLKRDLFCPLNGFMTENEINFVATLSDPQQFVGVLIRAAQITSTREGR